MFLVFFCFGSLEINPNDDDLLEQLEMLELGVKLLGGLVDIFCSLDLVFLYMLLKLYFLFYVFLKRYIFFDENSILINIFISNFYKKNS